MKLPVLMYHQVSQDRADALTVPLKKLEAQFAWISRHYQTVFIRDLLAPGFAPLKPPLLITFDDGYKNNSFVFPLLEKFDLKMTLFVPTGHVGKINSWDGATESLLSLDELRALNFKRVELASHGHDHIHFLESSISMVENDLVKSFSFFQQENLPYTRSLAYPFGKYPLEIESLLKKLQVPTAFRIGNRLNHWPLTTPHLIQRLDIQGNLPFWRFKLKVRLGKPF